MHQRYIAVENIVRKGEIACNKQFSLFSSPEHNVLRGSYCDRSSSVRPSVRLSVNNFFKNLLLQNQKANLDKTWQECSLGEALQKLLKEFHSNKNSGCHGNKMAENGKKTLKIFL